MSALVLKFAPVVIPIGAMLYLAFGVGWLGYDAWMRSRGYWRPNHDL